ncbi:MAG: type 1 glutamine amidotransferase [Myxococcota bacterium]|nr:type 1 glutamine amidotransferase [Myxococcota bacterium]
MDQPPRLLLMQARRHNDPMALHEQQCFADALGVTVADLPCHNILDGEPSQAIMDRTDLILIGGSGDFSVTDNEPFIHGFIDFLADICVMKKTPTFGSCFGFQGLVMAAGGTVETDTSRAEVGTFDITLTEAGVKDPLFDGIERTFKAQLGHKDLATSLPSGVSHLASSERAPYQAIRVPDTDVFATQFHPELSRQANTTRYLRYQAGYSVTKELRDSDSVLASMADSPAATSLLPRWVKLASQSL